ncbi:MAG: hypothetical protein ACYTEQ_14350 [Planctomycetota bacterium]|jgi:hypothetical protein
MNPEQFEKLKERYDFGEWQNRNNLTENLFIWRFSLLHDQFGNWKASRMRTLEAPTEPGAELLLGREIEVQGQRSRLVQSVWQQAEGGADAVLSVDAYEFASRAAAHEALVRMLAEFQSPQVKLRQDIPVGDVAFSHPGGRIILFARANLVLVLRTIGRTDVPVMDIARQLDVDLTSKPVQSAGLAAPAIRRCQVSEEETEVENPVRLDLDVAQTEETPVMVKIFSKQGQVVFQEGGPVYRPSSSGEEVLEVYAITPDRGVASESAQIRIK